ncbi:MAG: FMN-binding protein, partial [Peptococcaceae bacterium]|nr:FMN-binding protein [Peptococcaceae bacterium]
MGNMRDMRIVALFSLSLLFLCIASSAAGCGQGQGTALTEAEAAAVTDLCNIDGQDFKDISREVLNNDRKARFPAVAKVYEARNIYAFITKPVAYNGPVTLAVAIDGDSSKVIGIRIVEHKETPHYVRDMESAWFIERFTGKSATGYLKAARLAARDEKDIVAITGATVTTEGIVNGVNAALGVYQEYVLGEAAGEVPYMVRFEPGEGDGPVETGSLAFRAYGLVLAEVSLDEIRSLPSVKRTMSIHSSSGVTSHEFRGTLLSDIMMLIDPSLTEEYGWILAVGVDDYISGISMDEVLAENAVYVMY